MSYREPLYERRRQAKRQRRRIIWACVHMAIFAASTAFILSRAAQMQDFVDQLRRLVQQQPEMAQRPSEPVQMGPPVVRRQEQPKPRLGPQRRMPGTAVHPASVTPVAVDAQPVATSHPPERSLADLLDPADQEPQVADEPEEPQEWELIFDFDSGLSSVEIPGDVDVSTLELTPAGGIGIAEYRKDLPLASGQAVRRLRDAEAVQFQFDTELAASPGGNTRITMRAMAMNLAGRQVSFRRRGAEAAVLSQQRIILRTSNQLAVAVARRQQLSNWLSSVGTKAITARAAAKNEVAALSRTIKTLQTAIAAQQKVLQAYLATVKLGESLDDSPAFVIRLPASQKTVAKKLW